MSARAEAQSEKLYWEDIPIGAAQTFGRHELSAAEIVEYASRYDPQAMHLDDEAARETIVGGLCAAGIHSCGIMMRLLTDHYLSGIAGLGSPGVEELQFLKPVRPGTVLSARHTCLEKRVSNSRPGVGLCKILMELLDEHGTPLLTWRSTLFVARRTTVGV